MYLTSVIVTNTTVFAPNATVMAQNWRYENNIIILLLLLFKSLLGATKNKLLSAPFLTPAEEVEFGWEEGLTNERPQTDHGSEGKLEA